MTDAFIYDYFIETPIGVIAFRYMETPFRLTRVLLPNEVSEEEDNIGKIGPAPPAIRSHPIRKISASVIDYFKGHPITPPWNAMDLNKFTLLQKSVLYTTADIPYGGLRSYRDIAVAIDRPRACRFVGTTLANNPYPILIPCHRVVRSDGKTGKFGGGTLLKKKLIDLESSHR